MEKKDDGLDIFREIRDQLGFGKHFEQEVVDAFEKAIDTIEESDPRVQGS